MLLLTEAKIFPAQTGLVKSRLLYAIQVDRVFSCELCGLFVVVGQGFRSAWEEVVMWVGRTTVRTGNQSVSQSVNQTDSQIVSRVGPSGGNFPPNSLFRVGNMRWRGGVNLLLQMRQRKSRCCCCRRYGGTRSFSSLLLSRRSSNSYTQAQARNYSRNLS